MFGFLRRKSTPSGPDLTTRLGRLQKGRENVANSHFDPGVYLHGNTMCAVGGMMKVYVDQVGNRDAYTRPEHIKDYLGDLDALNTATKRMTKKRYGEIEQMAIDASRQAGLTKGKELVLTAYDNAIMEEAARKESEAAPV